MEVTLHKLARTTPAIRREIQRSDRPVKELSERYGVTAATIYKWRKRSTTQDYSHARHRLLSSLDAAQEALVVGLRRDVGLSLDDIVEVMRRCNDASLSRSAIYRCLKRHHAAGKPVKGRQAQPNAFQTVAGPGFIHMDVKHLTTLKGKRSYVYVAIDRATRFVYAEILYDLKQQTAASFVARFLRAFPAKVTVILTDNGMEWTDRCNHTVKDNATGNHPVDLVCKAHGIEHRLTKPRRPQTNGMAERFNRRLNEAIAQKSKLQENNGKNSFSSHHERNQFILQFVWNYNHTRLQCLNYNAPRQLLYDQTEQYT